MEHHILNCHRDGVKSETVHKQSDVFFFQLQTKFYWDLILLYVISETLSRLT